MVSTGEFSLVAIIFMAVALVATGVIVYIAYLTIRALRKYLRN